MSKPVIAIVGRPNVGKSSIFNALTGERISIVHDSPGVTRDRIYAEAEWFGREFTLVDTGGLEIGSEDPLLVQMRRQVDFALETADVVIFVGDSQEGLTSGDRDISEMLRKSGVPVVLAVNKCDAPGHPPETWWEFYELGFGEPFAISSAHKLGLGELVSAALELVPEHQEEAEEDGRIKVAVIGKPNVGKSSFVNRLLNEERTIVSDIAGTTRDALDVDLDNRWGSYRIIDTAGLRKRSRIDGQIEKYSVLRTEAAIERADVCLIMIDASEGITEQDTKVAGRAHEAGKASVFVINKWDLIEKDNKTFRHWELDIRERFGFMRYAPILSISVLSGQRVDDIFTLINEVYTEARKRLGTGVINEVLAEAVALHMPPQDKGKKLKIYYATQVDVAPPQIVLFINDKELLHFSYERYLENRFREAFGFKGSPLKMIWRERKSSDYIRVKDKSQEQETDSL